ncbi:MAG: hypothetical protein JO362_12785, partial [Streptomycetaceae bacterium]|nr:hypothetical protein [Streptomycetaceae bacterium]
EVDELQLKRIALARAKVRRRVWALLERREEGFPWITVNGRPLEGWTVIDSDATAVACASEKEGAAGSFTSGDPRTQRQRTRTGGGQYTSPGVTMKQSQKRCGEAGTPGSHDRRRIAEADRPARRTTSRCASGPWPASGPATIDTFTWRRAHAGTRSIP